MNNNDVDKLGAPFFTKERKRKMKVKMKMLKKRQK